MKRLGLSLIIIGFSGMLYGQQKTDEFQTIFGNQIVKFGGMGGFEMNFSSLGGYFSYGSGGGGGVILNKSVFVGGYGMGNYINRDVIIDNIDYDNLNFGHGGFWLGYIFNGNAAIHPFLGLKLGWGGISQNYDQHHHNIGDIGFIITPSVEMEFNITRYFRIAAGGVYQIATGLENSYGLTNSDFSGPGGNISFRFGWF
jgi:hypothetical protein